MLREARGDLKATDLPASRGIRPKALQLSALIRMTSDRHSMTGNANLLVQLHKRQ